MKPELMYFNVPGRVAGLRIVMFKLYGKDGWDDKRVSFSEWAQVKPTLPLQYMPLLRVPLGVDGDASKVRQIHQAEAILRWAGKKAGLYPSDADEALLIDEMVSTIHEALAKGPRPSSVVTKEMMPGLWKDFLEGPCKMYFDYIQKQIKGFQSDTPSEGVKFFRGSSDDDLTIADLALYMLVNYFVNGEIPYVEASYMDSWPGILANYAAVKAHPIVQAYTAAYAWEKDAVDEVAKFAEVDTSAIRTNQEMSED